MAFTYRLKYEDGAPATPPVLHTAVPNWRAGDTIPLGNGRALQVIGARNVEDDAILIVEEAR